MLRLTGRLLVTRSAPTESLPLAVGGTETDYLGDPSERDSEPARAPLFPQSILSKMRPTTNHDDGALFGMHETTPGLAAAHEHRGGPGGLQEKLGPVTRDGAGQPESSLSSAISERLGRGAAAAPRVT